MAHSPDSPAAVPLQPGVLHLVRARLDAPPWPREHLAAVLSDDERARIARFRFPHLQRRHEAATGLLRRVLARIVDRDPADLRFEVGEHGKPHLPGGPAFNQSHSGEWWMLGVASEGRVGVDVEVHRTLHDLDDLARNTFHPAEADDVLNEPSPEERTRAFFRVWSRKEAFIKAVGRGLSYPLAGFRVSARAEPPREILAIDDPADDVRGWCMRSVPWDSTLAAAVSWDRPEGRVVWTPALGRDA